MAPTNYYVDNVAGNDTTGDGTVGTPWATAQKALDTITRDATNGDQVNVKAGGTEVVAAALSLTTYGTPTVTAPLVFRGYTASANDGGIGVLSGGGNNRSIIDSSTLDYIHFIDMRLTNCGTSTVARVDSYCMFYNCEVDTSTGVGLMVGANCLVALCNIHDVATASSKHAVYCNGTGIKCVANRIYAALGSSSYAIIAGGASCFISRNVIRIGNASDAIYVGSAGDGAIVDHNSVFGAASTGSGINVVSGADNVTVTNNIVEGFSGSGGKGITIAGTTMLYHSNAIYNCATAESITGVVFGYNANNDTLAGSAFVAGSTDDFRINGTVTGVTEDAWPSAFLGASSTTPKGDKGASQSGAGSGGGSTIIVIED